MEQIMTWVGPTLDVAAVVLLALVLWRLGHEPGTEWSEREARLRTIFDDLRALVAQSEGLARDLDAKLAGRETRLQTLVAEAQAALAGTKSAPPERPARPDRIEVRDDEPRPATAAAGPAALPTTAGAGTNAADPAETARRIEELAEDGIAIEEIARRLGVAAAEVRLVIGLRAARTARRRSATTAAEARAHA